MGLSRRFGASIDRSFFNVLAGKSALERGARKAAGGIKRKIQQARINKQRGYTLEKQKYGRGTLTTQKMISGPEQGKKVVTYRERGAGGYQITETPPEVKSHILGIKTQFGRIKKEKVVISPSGNVISQPKKQKETKPEAVYVGGQKADKLDIKELFKSNPDLAKANEPKEAKKVEPKKAMEVPFEEDIKNDIPTTEPKSTKNNTPKPEPEPISAEPAESQPEKHEVVDLFNPDDFKRKPEVEPIEVEPVEPQEPQPYKIDLGEPLDSEEEAKKLGKQLREIETYSPEPYEVIPLQKAVKENPGIEFAKVEEPAEPFIEAQPAKLPEENIVETAKAMGLSDEQIQQAKDEGVTTALGLRRIEKNEREPADFIPEPLIETPSESEPAGIAISPLAIVDDTPETSMAEDMGFSLPEEPKPVESGMPVYRKGTTEGNLESGTFYYIGNKPPKGKDYYKGELIEMPPDFEYNIETNINPKNVLKVPLLEGNDVFPSDYLANQWFPERDFKTEAEDKGIESWVLTDKVVAEEARKRGYDAIQYGDNMIQHLSKPAQPVSLIPEPIIETPIEPTKSFADEILENFEAKEPETPEKELWQMTKDELEQLKATERYANAKNKIESGSYLTNEDLSYYHGINDELRRKENSERIERELKVAIEKKLQTGTYVEPDYINRFPDLKAKYFGGVPLTESSESLTFDPLHIIEEKEKEETVAEKFIPQKSILVTPENYNSVVNVVLRGNAIGEEYSIKATLNDGREVLLNSALKGKNDTRISYYAGLKEFSKRTGNLKHDTEQGWLRQSDIKSIDISEVPTEVLSEYQLQSEPQPESPSDIFEPPQPTGEFNPLAIKEEIEREPVIERITPPKPTTFTDVVPNQERPIINGMVQTASGRNIPAPPGIRLSSNRVAVNDIKKVDNWIVEQAKAEAQAKGETFAYDQFNYMNPKKLTPADKDILNDYLFGETNPTFIRQQPTPEKVKEVLQKSEFAQRAKEQYAGWQGKPEPQPADISTELSNAFASTTESVTPDIVPASSNPQGKTVARRVERKMRSDTGEEADYVTEYYLVHNPNDYRPEVMGNPYQLYRKLTVGGEVRSDDLLETGQTPEKIAEVMPWESSYKEAEKFGVFKTKYDKYQAERQAKADAEQAKKDKEYQDTQRFAEIVKPLESAKGIGRITVNIATWPEGNTGPTVRKPVEGLDAGNGIGIAVSGEGKYKRYTVTHLNSGLAMGHDWSSRAEAIALAKAVTKTDDWSKYTTEKDVPKESMDKASALVRAFTSKSIDENTAKSIQEKPLSVKEAFSVSEPETFKGSTTRKPRKPFMPKPFTLSTQTGRVRTIKGVGKTRRIQTGDII